MDLIHIFTILKRKIWIIILVPVFTGGASLFFTSKLEKEYKSNVLLSTGFTTGEQISFSNDRPRANEAGTKFVNVIETMSSPLVLNLVSYSLLIHELEQEDVFRELDNEETLTKLSDEVFITSVRDMIKTKLEKFELLNPYIPEEKAIISVLDDFEYDYESLDEKLRINRVSSSDYISISFFSENPFLSAYVVNTLSDEFIRYYKTINSVRSEESVEFFEERLTEKKKILDDRIEKLNRYKVSNSVINYTVESEKKIALINQYELKREDELQRISDLELSVNDMNDKIKAAGGDLGSNAIAQANQRILNIQNKINDLEKVNGALEEEDPELTSTIDKLRLQLNTEMNRVNEMQKNDVDELTEQRDNYLLELEKARKSLLAVNGTLSELRASISSFAGKEAELSKLERDVTIATEEYKSVQGKLNSARNESLVAAGTLNKIIQGEPADKPESSKKFMLVALAVMASFSLCLISIVLVDYMDQSIRVPSRLERFSGLTNIGSLNKVNMNKLDLHKLFSDNDTKGEFDIFKQLVRKLRYEIQDSGSRLFLITSTRPGVGKTFFIVSMAYSLSLIDKRVLIVDTNFKHNSLTKLLAKNNGQKLLEKGNRDHFEDSSQQTYGHQTNNDDPESASGRKNGHNIVASTAYPGIDIIGNIGGNHSPLEIFTGRDFQKMLTNISEEYDYVFMEGASMNNYSDTKELMGYAERVISIFSAQTSLSPIDMESIKFLKGLKNKILGTALNGVEVKDMAI
ncbi:MAG: Wzz/FepE/Etk N-terminal domain-containing protein [Bacteroidota bacterium]